MDLNTGQRVQAGQVLTHHTRRHAARLHCCVTDVSFQDRRQVALRPLARRKAATAAASGWLYTAERRAARACTGPITSQVARGGGQLQGSMQGGLGAMSCQEQRCDQDKRWLPHASRQAACAAAGCCGDRPMGHCAWLAQNQTPTPSSKASPRDCPAHRCAPQRGTKQQYRAAVQSSAAAHNANTRTHPPTCRLQRLAGPSSRTVKLLPSSPGVRVALSAYPRLRKVSSSCCTPPSSSPWEAPASSVGDDGRGCGV